MKIRNGFVSNSSSASFIIKIKSELSDLEIHNLIRESDEWLDKWWEGGEYKTIDFLESMNSRKNGLPEPPEITVYREPLRDNVFSREEDGVIELSLSTTMFNDWMDVPTWKFIRAIQEEKFPDIKLVEILQTDGEEHVHNTITELDTRCWEYKEKINDLDYFGTNYRAKQNEIDMEYFKYLVSVGYVPTDEEVIKIAKNQLNQ